MAERREAVEFEIQALQDRRTTLESEVKYLSNERGMESELRKQFDVARKGEQVVIILDEKANPTVDSDATTTATSTRAWYRFW